jgi:hypothetical protein
MGLSAKIIFYNIRMFYGLYGDLCRHCSGFTKVIYEEITGTTASLWESFDTANP